MEIKKFNSDIDLYKYYLKVLLEEINKENKIMIETINFYNEHWFITGKIKENKRTYYLNMMWYYKRELLQEGFRATLTYKDGLECINYVFSPVLSDPNLFTLICDNNIIGYFKKEDDGSFSDVNINNTSIKFNDIDENIEINIGDASKKD